MRCYNRENMIFHGNYLDVNIYPVFASNSKKGSRRKKAKPTSEVQQLLNERNAKKKIVYLLNENFTESDYALHLSYDKFHLPASFEDAEREEDNFIRRLRRSLKKIGVELKYYSALEQGEKSGRLHHHIVVSGGLSIKQIAEIWGNGYIQVKPLQFNETGITNLSYYISKETKGRKRLRHSRNLKMPTEKQRDGRISKKTVKELHNHDCDIKAVCKKYYPEYEYADMEAKYNDFNGQYYITLRLYKPEIFNKRKRRAENLTGQWGA